MWLSSTIGPTILVAYGCIIAIASSELTQDDICGKVGSGRIIGGKDAPLGRYPWQGLFNSSVYRCGLSLIDNEWAITAAHCVTPKMEATLNGVLFGLINSNGSDATVQASVDRIYVHPGYNNLLLLNDIALLHLDPPVRYSLYVRPICMETNSDETSRYETCLATGFGELQLYQQFPDILQEVELDLQEKNECVGFNISDNHICAGGYKKGVCRGDSGGPLACQREDGRFSLVGISSFISTFNGTCGDSSSAFTRVSQYNDFIQNVIENRDTTPNCEPVAHPACAEALPYMNTYATSQEDLFWTVDYFISIINKTLGGDAYAQSVNIVCSLAFRDCSEDPTRKRIQPCRQLCMDLGSVCAFPIGETLEQEYCPYGPDPVCSGHFNLTDYPITIKSPNFPEEYFPLTHCQWTLSAPEGYGIFVKQMFFQTQERVDNVVFGSGTDPEDRSSSFWRGSGSLIPEGTFLNESDLWITFTPDDAYQNSGFEYQFLAVRRGAECTEGFFTCVNESVCIPDSWVCDGVDDCSDGEDESSEMCPGTTSSDLTHDDICGTVEVGRIIGGQDALLGRYPWQGKFNTSEYGCGLSLIDSEWAITAAHCITPQVEPTLNGVLFGLVHSDGSDATVQTSVDRIYVHPGYNDVIFLNDIALFHLDPPVSYSLYVRPICLETNSDETSRYETCLATGFGSLQYMQPGPEILQEVELDLQEKDECIGINITDNHICAAGYKKGICPGDSGGPLACQREDGRFSLVGISSFISVFNGTCGDSSSAFTRVSQYNDFIHNVIENRDTTPNCEPVAHPVCAEVLPYTNTYATSQEDLFSTVDVYISYVNELLGGDAFNESENIMCSLVFRDCSEDPTRKRIQPCRQLCTDIGPRCTFPIGETPEQEYCPYGPDLICSGHFNLTDHPTTIKSPNFPEEYFPLTHCQWTLSAPEGYGIFIKQMFFETEERFDNVVFGIGPDPEDRSSAFWRGSGSLFPGGTFLNESDLWITFTPDSSYQLAGFEYRFTAVSRETDFMECSDGALLLPSDLCDDIQDCQDGSDEAECGAQLSVWIQALFIRVWGIDVLTEYLPYITGLFRGLNM